MGDAEDILQGFEHQLQEQAEDVTPYYMQQNDYASTPEYPFYITEHYEDDLDTTYLLTWVLVFLAVLIFICTIIMVVLCVKLCCQNQPETQQLVPPPFIYVTPFIPPPSASQQTNPNHPNPVIQNTFHE